ncbi:VPS13 domain-containing protein [Mycena venus]|uniref:VPS13 domain-containing protein n=1 Tax=Mycena venus TaxID=2733690 RepID=A0A8H6XK74_9AGAR|nr:VPS13 domain-containing protein [Mycena venus]
MPMPRLLKKLSRKSLRKRSQSTTSSLSVDVQQLEAPPLPIPKSATSTVSFGYVIPNTLPNGSSPFLLPSDSYSEKNFPQTPNTPSVSIAMAPNGAQYAPPPLPPPLPVAATNGNAVPQDEFSKNLQGAWASATTDPKVSKTDKVLLQMENGVAGAIAKETKGAAVMDGIKTGLEAVGGMEAIEKGLNTFMEGMPVLMNALDEVAKLHPYVSLFYLFIIV